MIIDNKQHMSVGAKIIYRDEVCSVVIFAPVGEEYVAILHVEGTANRFVVAKNIKTDELGQYAFVVVCEEQNICNAFRKYLERQKNCNNKD